MRRESQVRFWEGRGVRVPSATRLQLLVCFATERLGVRPCRIEVEQLTAPLILDFLDNLERERNNSVGKLACGRDPESFLAPAMAGGRIGDPAGSRLRRGRRDPPSLGQGKRIVADDDVVEELDVDEAERVAEAGGHLEVAGARQGTAAGVNMLRATYSPRWRPRARGHKPGQPATGSPSPHTARTHAVHTSLPRMRRRCPCARLCATPSQFHSKPSDDASYSVI